MEQQIDDARRRQSSFVRRPQQGVQAFLHFRPDASESLGFGKERIENCRSHVLAHVPENARASKSIPLHTAVLRPKQSRVRMVDAQHRDLDARRRQLLWRATHRGTRELDLVLGGFAAAHIATMNETELAELEQLVGLDDPRLTEWILGGSSVDGACRSAIAARLLAWREKFA